jgi:hypothetical protein
LGLFADGIRLLNIEGGIGGRFIFEDDFIFYLIF